MQVIEWSGELPDLLALKAAQPRRYPALFATGGQAGWDILFAFPHTAHVLPANATAHQADEFFSRLPQPSRTIRPDKALPFTGGWLLALSYELGSVFEPTVGMAPDAMDFPLAWALRIPAAILVNHQSRQTWLLTENGRQDWLACMQADLLACPPVPTHNLPEYHLLEDPPERFMDGISQVKSYIREGDVFQVNLSRGWQVDFSQPIPPIALYQRLRQRNPAPFSAVVEMGDWAIVSSSPERLVKLDTDGKLVTRPIAGTHPRGATTGEDETLKARLAAHPKERAEHIMLVDLERNDLGRVCEPGSVKVEALMELASYAHVHHLESTVSGRLRLGTSLFELMKSVFPGGTITGCPKVRTMQIIRELERTPRHIYTGSLGYVNLDGTLDMNILIRSFMLRRDQAWFRTGAGIVADSDPERELAETRAKAMGLLKALGEV